MLNLSEFQNSHTVLGKKHGWPNHESQVTLQPQIFPYCIELFLVFKVSDFKEI